MNKNFVWNQEIIKQITDAEIYGNWSSNRICIDTRKLQNGDIFVAFKGMKVDGHDYVKEAFERGAIAAIIQYIPNNLSQKNANLATVKDSAKAVRDLATFNRNRCQGKIIAVTGSVGKTSTKEALYKAFSALGKTHCSEGNYNNELGLAISLANMQEDAEYAIYELGMNHAGELAMLAETLKPDLAIITTIAPVHLQNFESLEDIARAKAEIFLGLSESGIAILNGDNEYYNLLAELAAARAITRILSFGQKKLNDGQLVEYKRAEGLTHIQASIMGEQINYQTKAHGEHQAINTIAVLLAVKSLGLSPAKAALGLAEFTNAKGRGEARDIPFNDKKILLIDESYNASPKSVQAALDSLKEVNGAAGRRKLAILADMYELGDDTVEMHKSLLPALERSGVDKVITVGGLMKNLFDIMPEDLKLTHFSDFRAAINDIYLYINDNDCVLVKGSFGTKIHELVSYLEGRK